MIKSILLAIALSITVGASAQTSKAKENWVKLFNGKDLSGWKQLGGKAKYIVEKGEIVGTTVVDEPNSFLATDKNYDDFILELEFKVDPRMNSGIQFRSESKPEYQNGRVHGYQMEIDPSARAWSGGIYDEGRRLWLYTHEYNEPAKKAFRNNEWNRYRIECIGNTVRTWVNGIPAAHLVDDLKTTGFIALQVHSIGKPEEAGRQIRWRNIRIQTSNLKPSPETGIFVVNLVPNALTDAEKKNGVKLLWNGINTDGWRGAYKKAFPEKGWKIEEGMLRVMPAGGGESTNGGDIVSEEMFNAFELQFDFRFTEGANSGVKYFVTEQEQNSGSAIGLEYQILDDAKHPDAKEGVVGNRTIASLYDLIPSLKPGQAIKKPGEWNRGMIRVHPDNRVEHFLNGYKVVEYQRGTPIYQALVARSKYAVWPNFGMAEKGRILLQDHGNAVDFRSIKIRQL
ncbi:3-keto-disaccharide hydrolase [Flavihumibacter sp.]|uniref:3-keto-disaccharide hydrolase n=1 Tax=Flavihumibacter sp. TaxID=1913981 RepID=UPI002FC8D52F